MQGVLRSEAPAGVVAPSRPTAVSRRLGRQVPVVEGNYVGTFNVLLEAGLAEAGQQGATVIWRLKMTVQEDTLLGFAESFGLWGTKLHPAAKIVNPRTRIAIADRCGRSAAPTEA